RLDGRRRSGAKQCPDSEVDQIGGAERLHDTECGRRRDKNGGQACRRRGNVNERSGGESEHRHKASALSLTQAPCHDVQDSWPGDQQKHEGGGYEPKQRRTTRHSSLLEVDLERCRQTRSLSL